MEATRFYGYRDGTRLTHCMVAVGWLLRKRNAANLFVGQNAHVTTSTESGRDQRLMEPTENVDPAMGSEAMGAESDGLTQMSIRRNHPYRRGSSDSRRSSIYEDVQSRSGGSESAEFPAYGLSNTPIQPGNMEVCGVGSGDAMETAPMGAVGAENSIILGSAPRQSQTTIQTVNTAHRHNPETDDALRTWQTRTENRLNQLDAQITAAMKNLQVSVEPRQIEDDAQLAGVQNQHLGMQATDNHLVESLKAALINIETNQERREEIIHKMTQRWRT